MYFPLMHSIQILKLEKKKSEVKISYLTRHFIISFKMWPNHLCHNVDEFSFTQSCLLENSCTWEDKRDYGYLQFT